MGNRAARHRILPLGAPSRKAGHDGAVNEAHLVLHLKQALAIVRGPEGRVAGAAVALEAGGRRAFAAPWRLARDIAEGRSRLVRHGPAEALVLDEESGLGLLALPEEGVPRPLRSLAVAPADDGEPLVATGPGLTVPTGEGDRHLWISRSARLAGRLHAFVEGRKQEEFRYLLDLPEGTLPPGSPVARCVDGALLGLLAEARSPEPSLSLALPVREAVALLERLGPGPA